MLDAATDDGVKNRVLAMGDRIDLDHLTVGACPIILRKFAERPFGLANPRQDTALDHDFRMRRHPHTVGAAFYHFDRTVEQRARDFHFVVVECCDRLRSQNAGRVHPDHKCDLETIAGLLGHPEVMQGCAGAAIRRRYDPARSPGSGESRTFWIPVFGLRAISSAAVM